VDASRPLAATIQQSGHGDFARQRAHTCDVESTIPDSDIARFKPRHRSSTEDEISSPRDETLLVVLVALVCEQCVLEAVEGAPIVPAGSLCAQCNCLAAAAICVRVLKSVLWTLHVQPANFVDFRKLCYKRFCVKQPWETSTQRRVRSEQTYRS